LLDVVVVEVDDGVPIGMGLPANSIREYHLFLSIEVSPLDLAVVADDLLLDRVVVGILLVVVLAWELHFVILLVL
jgi:hypothetical protein